MINKERARELFCERYPEYKDKTICIYIGIKTYESPTNRNRNFEQIKLITVGSVYKRKNQLPLIMTDVGGCRDLIDNNGLLIGTSVEEI